LVIELDLFDYAEMVLEVVEVDHKALKAGRVDAVFAFPLGNFQSRPDLRDSELAVFVVHLKNENVNTWKSFQLKKNI
jgi:hypothetical protein